MSNNLFTIALFFLYTYGLGCIFTCFKRKEDGLESFFMRVGLGLASLPLLAITLSILHVPLHWAFIFGLSLMGCLGNIVRHGIKLPQCLSKESIIVLGLFLCMALIYCMGPFTYPWLENDDPWGLAAGVKYISLERTVFSVNGLFHYLNPYPPGYSFILALMHQTAPSLSWVLKFFNGLIIALSFPFFFYFVKSFSHNTIKSLLAAVTLSAIPCYLSHFIWAHALAVTLFFPAFYFILKSFKDNKFMLPCAVSISGILLTQPTQSIKFIILLLILFGCYAALKQTTVKHIGVVLITAVILSLFWWGGRIADYQNNTLTIARKNSQSVSGKSLNISSSFIKKSLFNPREGTATRAYTFEDYVVLRPNNLINNPIGVGGVLCCLAFFGIYYMLKKLTGRDPEEKTYALTILGWLVFTFLGINSATFNLPIGLFAFRFWMLFAIPVSLLAAETLYQTLPQEKGRLALLRTSTVVGLLIIIIMTSGAAKFRVNTNVWPWGVYWNSFKELNTYMWLRFNLPPDTKVFAFTDNLFVIGHDMRADYWSEEYKQAFATAFEDPLETLHQRLRDQGFVYVIMGEREIKRFGQEAVLEKIISLNKSGLFETVVQIGHNWVLKIN